ncbi:hypothetical protein ACFL34_05125 [Candidatus Sumerlaeota bacterium]
MNPVPCNVCWLGIDLAKLTFDAAIANSSTPFSEWRSLPVKQFGNHHQGRVRLADPVEDNTAQLAGYWANVQCLACGGGPSLTVGLLQTAPRPQRIRQVCRSPTVREGHRP